MGKNKLRKFEEMKGFDCVFEYPWARLQKEEFPLRGKWHSEFFGNDNPILLELGCGKGDYTVALARRNPDKNYIGIDVKGARIWTGAKAATVEGLKNVAFIRGEIEQIESFFAPEEVDEIWITFPDPQMKKVRKRLSSARFLELYRHILRPDGIIHLKTDSPFLHTFSSRLAALNLLPTICDTPDLYGSGLADPVKSIKTHYEKQWLARGKKIKLLEFRLPKDTPLQDPPEEDIPFDDYTSFPRGIAQCMPEELKKLAESQNLKN